LNKIEQHSIQLIGLWTNFSDKSTTFWVQTNCFNVQMKSSITNVLKNQNYHQLEIKKQRSVWC